MPRPIVDWYIHTERIPNTHPMKFHDSVRYTIVDPDLDPHDFTEEEISERIQIIQAAIAHLFED